VGSNNSKHQKNSGIVTNDSTVDIVVNTTESAKSACAINTNTFEKPPLGQAAMSRMPINTESVTGAFKITRVPTNNIANIGNVNV
jgi:hypothetical protein